MTTSESVEFYIRFVKEKHQTLATEVDTLIKILVSDDIAQKKAAAKTVLGLANDLNAATSNADKPSWLPLLTTGLSSFIDGISKPHLLMKNIMENYEGIKNQKWIFENKTNNAFDFDAIFQHYKSQSRLSELFDEIIKILEDIQKSNEIDSVSMMTGLGKVIATLKKNKDGSYFSLNSTWEFLVSFLKNYMWAELSKLPILGTAMEALEKTIKETNEEMFKVHANIQMEMERTIESEVKGLSKKSEFRFISYDKSGRQISGAPASSDLLSKV